MQMLGFPWQQWKCHASASPPDANTDCGSLHGMTLSIVPQYCVIPLDRHGEICLNTEGVSI